MPSGFFILLNFFLRVDGVLIRMNGTRFHYELGNNYIIKEFTQREAEFKNLKHVSNEYYNYYFLCRLVEYMKYAVEISLNFANTNPIKLFQFHLCGQIDRR